MRERQLCSTCHLNARTRVSVTLIRELLPSSSRRIWLAEQLTPLYATLRSTYPALLGSEFLGPEWESGAVNADGIRHGDCCRTSFPPGGLDAIASSDVLEHVPDYLSALAEAKRIVKPGGLFI